MRRMEWIASGALMDNKLSEANDESLSASMVADNTLGMLGRFSFTKAGHIISALIMSVIDPSIPQARQNLATTHW